MNNPLPEMRLWHVGILAALGILWRWLNKHLKELHAKFNGYTLEKKEKKP